jgi:hypothetical protein
MQVVRIDDKGRALEHVVKVTQTSKENVMWVALGNGGPWKITFDKPAGTHKPGSPFDNEYHVSRGSFVTTQNGADSSKPTGTYKYNVRDANNPNNATNIKDDPDVDVDP